MHSACPSVRRIRNPRTLMYSIEATTISCALSKSRDISHPPISCHTQRRKHSDPSRRKTQTQTAACTFAFVALHELMFGHTRKGYNRTSRTRSAHAQQPSLCPPTRGPSSAERHVRPTAKIPAPTSEQPRARNRATPDRPMRTTPPARPCGSRQHLSRLAAVEAGAYAVRFTDVHSTPPLLTARFVRAV